MYSLSSHGQHLQIDQCNCMALFRSVPNLDKIIVMGGHKSFQNGYRQYIFSTYAAYYNKVGCLRSCSQCVSLCNCVFPADTAVQKIIPEMICEHHSEIHTKNMFYCWWVNLTSSGHLSKEHWRVVAFLTY